MGGCAAPDRAGGVRSPDGPPQGRGAQGAARDKEETVAKKIDKGLYHKADGTSVCAIAGFNLALGAADRRLPRALRRVLAGVRRPRTAAERRFAFERGLVCVETRPSAGHPWRTYYPRADLRAQGSEVSQ